MMTDQGASDLFITAGRPPSIKIDGVIRPVGTEALTPDETKKAVQDLMTPKQRKEFEQTNECQFAIHARGAGRFRVSAFVQRNAAGMVLRRIETRIPTIEELNLPSRAARSEHAQARHRDLRRRHRHRQVHVPGGAGRLSQSHDHGPYHHDRRPHRVRARARRLHHHAARGGCGHRVVRGCAAQYAAPGTGRDPDRRDPNPRDHGLCHCLCRNRPSGVRDPARQQRQPSARPDHQLLPRRGASPTADGPVSEPARDRCPAAGAA
jgi:hypothetical protein